MKIRTIFTILNARAESAEDGIESPAADIADGIEERARYMFNIRVDGFSDQDYIEMMRDFARQEIDLATQSLRSQLKAAREERDTLAEMVNETSEFLGSVRTVSFEDWYDGLWSGATLVDALREMREGRR